MIGPSEFFCIYNPATSVPNPTTVVPVPAAPFIYSLPSVAMQLQIPTFWANELFKIIMLPKNNLIFFIGKF